MSHKGLGCWDLDFVLIDATLTFSLSCAPGLGKTALHATPKSHKVSSWGNSAFMSGLPNSCGIWHGCASTVYFVLCAMCYVFHVFSSLRDYDRNYVMVALTKIPHVHKLARAYTHTHSPAATGSRAGWSMASTPRRRAWTMGGTCNRREDRMAADQGCPRRPRKSWDVWACKAHPS